MPRTPERSRDKTTTEELELTTKAGAPAAGHARYDGSSFQMTDASGTFNPRSAGTDDRRVLVSADDTAPGFLEEKIESADASVLVTVTNPGGSEKLNLAVDLDETFRAQEMDAFTLIATSSTTRQDAFAGESPDVLVVDAAGDYYVVFHAMSRVTNANAEGELALSKNGSFVANTDVTFGGLVGFTTNTSAHRLSGCVVGDEIGGLYRKVSGPGSVELRNRSIFIVRIGM